MYYTTEVDMPVDFRYELSQFMSRIRRAIAQEIQIRGEMF